jgi:hypothetical protein
MELKVYILSVRTVLITTIAALVVASGALMFVERTRTVEGTWLYMFEGSSFFEGQAPPSVCDLYSTYSTNAAWLDLGPEVIYENYDENSVYPSTGVYRSIDGKWRLEAFSVKFKGRRKLSLIGAGHLGYWNSSYEVDNIIAAKPISDVNCLVR